MQEQLKAIVRERAGKGAARAIRREGMVPAVIYGGKQPPLPIALPFKETSMAVNTSGFTARVLSLDVDGKKHQVIAKDVQRDPVRDIPLHVDFMRVVKGSTLTVEVRVHFINEEEAPGLRRGGVLNIVRHEIECEAPADAVPEHIVCDLSGLDIGDGIHISSVSLPEGVKPTITDRDFTIATIASPAGLKSEESQTSDAPEGEDEGESEEDNGEQEN